VRSNLALVTWPFRVLAALLKITRNDETKHRKNSNLQVRRMEKNQTYNTGVMNVLPNCSRLERYVCQPQTGAGRSIRLLENQRQPWDQPAIGAGRKSLRNNGSPKFSYAHWRSQRGCAIRTWPFRVYSFPTDIVIAKLPNIGLRGRWRFLRHDPIISQEEFARKYRVLQRD